MAKVVRVEIQVLLLLADPVLISKVRARELLLEIGLEAWLRACWLWNVLMALPVHSVIVTLREIRHRHKLAGLVRHNRLRLCVTVALVYRGRHRSRIAILTIANIGTRLRIIRRVGLKLRLIWNGRNGDSFSFVWILRYCRGQMRMVASADALGIVDIDRLLVVWMPWWKPCFEYTKLFWDLIAAGRFRRGAAFVWFCAPLVEGPRFKSCFLTLLNILFYCLTATILLDLSIDAESVLSKCHQREVELLFDAETFEQFQITLGQSVHDLRLVELFLVFVALAFLQQIYSIQLIPVPAYRLVDLDLREVEQLFIPKGVVHDGDVLDDGAHLVA